MRRKKLKTREKIHINSIETFNGLCERMEKKFKTQVQFFMQKKTAQCTQHNHCNETLLWSTSRFHHLSKCLFFIFYSFSHQLSHFPCLLLYESHSVIFHNSRQALKVDRISLLIIFRLCVLAFAVCSGCFLSALETISFLSRLFFVLRSLSHFFLCVIEWVLSFTSIFCGYCTFAEIRRHRDDNVRVSLELYTCTFISVINLSYRSFRQTSRIHFAHPHIHAYTYKLGAFLSSYSFWSFFTTQNLLWCVWNQVFQHISTSTSFIAENKTKPIEMNTKAPLTWRFSLAGEISFKISFAYGVACQTFSRFYSALSSDV